MASADTVRGLQSTTVQDERRHRAPTRFLRSISIATRLALAVVVVSLVSLVAATFVGLRSGQELTREIVDERLIALANSGADDVAARLNRLDRVGESLAISPATSKAIRDFDEAFDELRQVPMSEAEDDVEDLVALYRTKYIEPIEESGGSIDVRDIVADDNPASLEIQKAYSVPPEEFIDVTQIDDAGDGSAWSEVHRRVHPTYRDIAERQELVDVLLVEPDRRYIVYSYAKNADIGTSLETGPFGGSVVAATVGAVIADPEAGARMSDFSTYSPNVLTPVAAVATPVFDGDEFVGVLVFLHGSAPITDVLTVGGQWESAGYPDTGETYLVGSDGLLRSEPRSFIENRVAHLEAAEEAGSVSSGGRQKISVSGSTVLIQRASDDTVRSAVEGDRGLGQSVTPTGISSFTSTEPVPIEKLDWYVVAEVERAAADGDLDTFAQWLVVGAAIFVVIVAFAAVSWSDRILRPIRSTSDRLRAWNGESVPEADVGDLEGSPTELRELVESFDAMLVSLDDQGNQLRLARARRVEMLRSLLPPAVAERVANGELESVEDVSNVTVAVLVVDGIADLVAGDATLNRALVNRLLGDLDDLGGQHGVERIKVLGDSYYAACGHNRPYIDHAPRVASFIADARDAVREIASESGHDLDIVAGVDTGTVHVGIARAGGLVYDVWGEAVTRAHNLARTGEAGQLLVSEASRALLPESVVTAAVGDVPGAYTVEPSSIGGAV